MDLIDRMLILFAYDLLLGSQKDNEISLPSFLLQPFRKRKHLSEHFSHHIKEVNYEEGYMCG